MLEVIGGDVRFMVHPFAKSPPSPFLLSKYLPGYYPGQSAENNPNASESYENLTS
jgi:hypothetical protein